MNAVLSRLRIEARRRWASWLSLALLLALFGGGVMAATAGSRRTRTAYPRYLAAQKTFDQFMLTGDFDPGGSFSPQEGQLRAMPEVEDVASAFFFANTEGINAIASGNPRFERSFNIPTAYKGRLPDPGTVNEAALPIAIAEQLSLEPGDDLTLTFVRADSDFEDPVVVPLTFTVTGISIAPAELPPGGDVPPPIRLTPAFYARYENELAKDRFTIVRLRNGERDLPAFRHRLDVLAGGLPILGFTQEAVSKNVQRSFELQAATLSVLAAMLGVAGVAVFAQTLARQTALEGDDYPVLRAVGMTRRQLLGLGLARAAAIGAAGALAAVLLAFLLSPLTPTGLGRAVEPSRGFRFDGLVLAGGGAAVLLVVLALAALPAWLTARRAGVVAQGAEEPARGSRVARLVSRVSKGPAASAGARFALEPGRGRTAVPVRSSLMGATLGLAALTMAFTFGGGLNHLVDNPRLYGVTWDMTIDVDEEAGDPAAVQAAIGQVAGTPGVAASEPVVLGLPFVLDGHPADALALAEEDQGFRPSLLAGRLPTTAQEIVVGPKTSRVLGKGIGDTVAITLLGGVSRPAKIVGVGVLPATGHTGNLGEGTLASMDLIVDIFGGGLFKGVPIDEIIVRLDGGASFARTADRIREELGPIVLSIDPPQTPADIVSFGRSESLPFVLAGVLALMAAGTIAHVLVTGIARRRRDLAILKTVGFVRGQVRGAVAWQATILIAIAIAVGLPLGVAAGRFAWTNYAESLGVLPVAVVPLVVVLLLVPAALALANVIAVYPGRSAARTRPAIVLRSE